ncbi:sulfatase [candidate division CSSED10-310 bacterium]|uniref:Sulfatase n=1 Tax=candidate division CSSED10-310 bacterium TaxID=2855610 RepID=A0ABV6Z6Y9_UNCC1
MGFEQKTAKKISRREILKYGFNVGFGACLGGTLGLNACGKSSHRPIKNVILIVLDTVRADTLGCYGNKLGITPIIDAVASEGIRFEQAISSSSWTIPALGSILTGTWPTIHGAFHMGNYMSPLRPEIPTAAEVFKENGFQTFGLANCLNASSVVHFHRGFDIFDDRTTMHELSRRADETIDTSLKWIKKHQKKSNFVLIHIFDPHLYYDPLPGYITKFTQGRDKPAPPLTKAQCLAMRTDHGKNPPLKDDVDYIKGLHYGEINFVDTCLARLINELTKLDLYDQTALVITSDHGEEFWDHNKFEHGHTTYDELIRVPLILKLPRTFPVVNKVVKAQVRNIDIMPTLFNLTKIKKPASFTGQSLLPFIMGQNESDLIAFSERLHLGYSEKLCWRTGDYKYILERDPSSKNRFQLYNLRNDLLEQRNIFNIEREITEKLHQDLVKFYSKIISLANTMSKTRVKKLNHRQIEILKSLGYIK